MSRKVKKEAWRKVVGLNVESKITISKSCSYLKYARSSFYKSVQQSKKRRELDTRVISDILKIKSVQPHIGGRKIHFMLRRILLETGFPSMGRDRLFSLLKEKNLLVKRKKYTVKTTNSNHPFKRYDNLIKGKEIKTINEVWVSDITYLRLKDSFCYLSLITDVFSRRIVGYCVNNTLEMVGTIKALKQALKNGTPKIHHSDRGMQYCSDKYTKILISKGTKISTTQDGNCYDNAIAERVNGILKTEFELSQTFESLKQVQKSVKQAIEVYNNERPHWSLNLKVSNQMYNLIA